ncbi:MCE family protein [Amycolatopsis acidicola]|uniref:MCE family protein n=1 Tax=Amycolatopsis acidicola TaxID=2596893 RepID=A0A5N0UYJ1_9PSEU|nr:MCE family protein [Amycolatopsis acidicola]KAA9156526.1 MCE family protein [Amycolatopsis acidicola]
MLVRKHWIKLFVFLVIAVVSVGYAGGRYAGLDRLFGARGYVVHAQFTDSGGIFTNAEVTYRGVAVGRVTALHLDPKGVTVDLDIDGDERIPASSEAVVADRSAIGEQYVDLRPKTEDGPYLREGSVITRDHTGLPVAPDTVLTHLDGLASSVAPQSLRTVVDETYDAFADTGPDLQRLLDTASSFTAEAQQNLPQTTRLLDDGRTVLETQQRQAGSITSIARSFRQISARLKSSDPDLRTVIGQAPGLADDLDGILATTGNDMGVLIANLLTTVQITSVRTSALEEELVAFPVMSAFGRSVSSNGEGQLGMVLDFFDPHSCTKGYEGTNQRGANDTADIPPNTQAYCAEPAGSATDVRGAQNAPYAGAPATPAQAPAASSPSAAPAQVPVTNQLPGVLGLARGQGTPSLGTLLGLAN